MTGNTSHHGRSLIMHIALQKCLSKYEIIFSRDNLVFEKTISRIESGRFHTQGVIKFLLNVIF